MVGGRAVEAEHGGTEKARIRDGALRALNLALGYAPTENKTVIQQEIQRATSLRKQDNALAEAKQRKSYAGVFEKMA